MGLLQFLIQTSFEVGIPNLVPRLLQPRKKAFVSFKAIDFLFKGCSNLLYVPEVIYKMRTKTDEGILA